MTVFFSLQRVGILFNLKRDEKFPSFVCYWSETFMKQKKKKVLSYQLKIIIKITFFRNLSTK